MAKQKSKEPARKRSPANPAKKKAATKKATVSPKAKTASGKSTGKAKPSTPARATSGKTSVKEKLTSVLPSGQKENSFFELVHEVARQIPRGRVTSYGAIAACLGSRLSARMVGWAMNAVPKAPHNVPAHRVVNSAGLLTGRHHFNPPERMQELLEKEGVRVVDNQVADFRKVFWDPSQEL